MILQFLLQIEIIKPNFNPVCVVVSLYEKKSVAVFNLLIISLKRTINNLAMKSYFFSRIRIEFPFMILFLMADCNKQEMEPLPSTRKVW